MLTRIRAKNFRLFKELDLELAKGVPTVLIGPNASGKSSVLELVDIGAQIANGQNLVSIFNSQRGGLADVQSRFGHGEVWLEFEFSTPEGSLSYSATIASQRGGGVQFRDERAIQDGLTIFASSRATSLAEFEPAKHSTFMSGGVHQRDPTISGVLSDAAEPSLWNLEKGRDRGKDSTDALDRKDVERRIGLLRLLRSKMESMRFHASFPTKPKWLEQSTLEGPRTSTVIGPASSLERTGHNLVNYLYNLSINNPDIWNQIVHTFRQEFPDAKELLFPADAGGGRIALAIRDRRFSKQWMYAYQMSDGMVQLLCVLAALVVPPSTASVVALDEPDDHMHPSAVRSIVSAGNAIAVHTPVIVATHNDRVLDVLADPAESIRVCTSDENGSHIQKLDGDTLRSWLEEYDPSDLRRKGMLDPGNAETLLGKGK
jgi:predicted ATPase